MILIELVINMNIRLIMGLLQRQRHFYEHLVIYKLIYIRGLKSKFFKLLQLVYVHVHLIDLGKQKRQFLGILLG